jgi:hypothetical protein
MKTKSFQELIEKRLTKKEIEQIRAQAQQEISQLRSSSKK